ncbi:phosphodiester glycosidase family protein [Nocardioides acrostichi]|uniref:Phosphodiester glycosidase family protein n=1 Tax=Nocardioides acrostichi TaxID=2784339 RepID=A0A930YAS9_9ACTN|nr:phosphodiester glycosidase family protein [Nocardioides acrostichi]MBF4161708.1 phosphodiester glycosidase family protein [Nocardioides acrostichi]
MLPRFPTAARSARLIAAALAVSLPLSAAATGLPARDGAAQLAPGRHQGTGHEGRVSSDRSEGSPAPRIAPGDQTPTTRSGVSRARVAPGVVYRSWTQTDARGPIRAHLLSVDLDVRGVGLDVVNPGHVAAVDTVPDLVRSRAFAVGGVNGDFYDIGKTGAPLGVSRSPVRGLFNARRSGWNNAFYVTRKGRVEFGQLPLRGHLVGHPKAKVTNVNSHFVLPGGIGVYTPRWGRAPGYDAVQQQRQRVRFLDVVNGRIVANRAQPFAGRAIRGMVLVGRGPGATQLRRLGKGRVAATYHLPGRPRLVITGSVLLIDDGVVKAVDDSTLAPRTAVGIDRDTHQLLILVVDGRSEKSRGYTMVELASMMQTLGADEALNLDGGGSSTMVRKRDDALRVANTPSDGFLRRVANALVVTYRKP